jgi:hypothetical protein
MGTNSGLWKLVNVVGPHLAQVNHGREYFGAPEYHENSRGIDGADAEGNTEYEG